MLAAYRNESDSDQMRRLLQVCRARNTPSRTFVNKMDREVQDPLVLMEESGREPLEGPQDVVMTFLFTR